MLSNYRPLSVMETLIERFARHERLSRVFHYRIRSRFRCSAESFSNFIIDDDSGVFYFQKVSHSWLIRGWAWVESRVEEVRDESEIATQWQLIALTSTMMVSKSCGAGSFNEDMTVEQLFTQGEIHGEIFVCRLSCCMLTHSTAWQLSLISDLSSH